jgi:hypothetical protein
MCGYAAAYVHSFCMLYCVERHVEMSTCLSSPFLCRNTAMGNYFFLLEFPRTPFSTAGGHVRVFRTFWWTICTWKLHVEHFIILWRIQGSCYFLFFWRILEFAKMRTRDKWRMAVLKCRIVGKCMGIVWVVLGREISLKHLNRSLKYYTVLHYKSDMKNLREFWGD